MNKKQYMRYLKVAQTQLNRQQIITTAQNKIYGIGTNVMQTAFYLYDKQQKHKPFDPNLRNQIREHYGINKVNETDTYEDILASYIDKKADILMGQLKFSEAKDIRRIINSAKTQEERIKKMEYFIGENEIEKINKQYTDKLAMAYTREYFMGIGIYQEARGYVLKSNYISALVQLQSQLGLIKSDNARLIGNYIKKIEKINPLEFETLLANKEGELDDDLYHLSLKEIYETLDTLKANEELGEDNNESILLSNTIKQLKSIFGNIQSSKLHETLNSSKGKQFLATHPRLIKSAKDGHKYVLFVSKEVSKKLLGGK